MGGITDRRNKIFVLDKELLFALYLRLGSYDLVGARLETEGVVNPETGKAFSRAGVRTTVMKSEGYRDYFDRRDADPTLPDEPTEAEYALAADIIKARMPIQIEMMAEIVRRKQQRLEDAEMYASYHARQN